jgi:hypothetical protein
MNQNILANHTPLQPVPSEPVYHAHRHMNCHTRRFVHQITQPISPQFTSTATQQPGGGNRAPTAAACHPPQQSAAHACTMPVLHILPTATKPRACRQCRAPCSSASHAVTHSCMPCLALHNPPATHQHQHAGQACSASTAAAATAQMPYRAPCYTHHSLAVNPATTYTQHAHRPRPILPTPAAAPTRTPGPPSTAHTQRRLTRRPSAAAAATGPAAAPVQPVP